MTPRSAIAICLVASLATLTAAGASRYAGGASPPPGDTHHAARHAVGAGAALRDGRAPRLRLAETGGSWPGSFFESLFGMTPPRSAPHRPARPRARRRSPGREPRRASPERRTTSPRSRGAESRRQSDDAGTYRTMCVRLCDGYYWPISFATGRGGLGRDSKVCRSSCDGPAALYYYPNPGGEPEDMVSLEGVPYTDLRTAFFFRTTYEASCKCRPHPWEAEAMERHRKYAPAKRMRAAAQERRRSR